MPRMRRCLPRACDPVMGRRTTAFDPELPVALLHTGHSRIGQSILRRASVGGRWRVRAGRLVSYLAVETQLLIRWSAVRIRHDLPISSITCALARVFLSTYVEKRRENVGE